MEELKKRYWDVIRKTRSSGRISPSVIEKAEKKWGKYEEAVIKQALEIHIKSYPSYKEHYTIGIMRNLQNCKSQSKPTNHSAGFEERKTDFGELEKRLLAQ